MRFLIHRDILFGFHEFALSLFLINAKKRTRKIKYLDMLNVTSMWSCWEGPARSRHVNSGPVPEAGLIYIYIIKFRKLLVGRTTNSGGPDSLRKRRIETDEYA